MPVAGWVSAGCDAGAAALAGRGGTGPEVWVDEAVGARWMRAGPQVRGGRAVTLVTRAITEYRALT